MMRLPWSGQLRLPAAENASPVSGRHQRLLLDQLPLDSTSLAATPGSSFPWRCLPAGLRVQHSPW